MAGLSQVVLLSNFLTFYVIYIDVSLQKKYYINNRRSLSNRQNLLIFIRIFFMQI